MRMRARVSKPGQPDRPLADVRNLAELQERSRLELKRLAAIGPTRAEVRGRVASARAEAQRLLDGAVDAYLGKVARVTEPLMPSTELVSAAALVGVNVWEAVDRAVEANEQFRAAEDPEVQRSKAELRQVIAEVDQEVRNRDADKAEAAAVAARARADAIRAAADVTAA